MTNEASYELEQFWHAVSFNLNQKRADIILGAAAYLQDRGDNTLLQTRQDLCSTLYYSFPMGQHFAHDSANEAELKKLTAALVDIGIAQICISFPELPYANRFWMHYKEQWGDFPEFPKQLTDDVVALAKKVNQGGPISAFTTPT